MANSEKIGHEVPKGMVRVKLEVTRRGKVLETFVPAKKKKRKGGRR